jgi:hypothetical protein
VVSCAASWDVLEQVTPRNVTKIALAVAAMTSMAGRSAPVTTQDTQCAVISESLTPSDEPRSDDKAETRDEITLSSRQNNAIEPEEPAIEDRGPWPWLPTGWISKPSFSDG